MKNICDLFNLGEAEKSYIQFQAKAGTKARWFYDSKIKVINSYDNFIIL